MSEAVDKQAAGADSGDILFQNVYVPTFLKVAQARGMNITTEAQLEHMLKISAMLRIHAESAGEAQAPGSALEKAASDLEAMTFGAPGPQDDVASFCQNPEIMAAAGAINAG